MSKLELEAALELRNGIPMQKAQQVAAVSNGNYREAIQQLQHADDDWEVFLRDWLNSIIKTGPTAQLKWVEEISKTGREKQKQFLKYFNHLIGQSIRLSISESLVPTREGNNEFDFATRLNKLCDISQLEAIIEELDNAVYYIERNANAKILFHALTIKLCHIINNKSVILVD